MSLCQQIKSISFCAFFSVFSALFISTVFQIVKTFIIPIFLYRVSLIPMGKDFVKQANKIIFDFIWKGKDKVERSSLVSEIEDGGLKAPHLESIIETQRVLCCKKLASDQPSSWKTILLHYLKPVGGKLVL